MPARIKIDNTIPLGSKPSNNKLARLRNHFIEYRENLNDELIQRFIDHHKFEPITKELHDLEKQIDIVDRYIMKIDNILYCRSHKISPIHYDYYRDRYVASIWDNVRAFYPNFNNKRQLAKHLQSLRTIQLLSFDLDQWIRKSEKIYHA